MIQVKESLEYFSRLLEKTLGIKSSAELFRKAKKNDYSVQQEMKHLLFQVFLVKYDLSLPIPLEEFLKKADSDSKAEKTIDDFIAISIALSYPNFTIQLDNRNYAVFDGPRRVLMILMQVLMSNMDFFKIVDSRLTEILIECAEKTKVPEKNL